MTRWTLESFIERWQGLISIQRVSEGRYVASVMAQNGAIYSAIGLTDSFAVFELAKFFASELGKPKQFYDRGR